MYNDTYGRSRRRAIVVIFKTMFWVIFIVVSLFVFPVEMLAGQHSKGRSFSMRYHGGVYNRLQTIHRGRAVRFISFRHGHRSRSFSSQRLGHFHIQTTKHRFRVGGSEIKWFRTIRRPHRRNHHRLSAHGGHTFR